MHTNKKKTLTTTLPTYLNTLTNKNIHIITINNYLTQHNTKNNHPLFKFLNLTININLPNIPTPTKHKTYTTNITYNTNNKYNFNYLHNNITFNPKKHIQHKLHYTLINKINSILINKTHTPLIISNPTKNNSKIYKHINKIIPHLIHQKKKNSKTFQNKNHFSINKKSHQINLTKHNLILIKKLLIKKNIINKKKSLYSPTNIILIHHITTTLHTHTLFTHNINYIIKNNKIIIINKHTNHTIQNHH